MPRTQRVATLRSSRPAQLQSEFLAPVAAIKGLCASFARELSVGGGGLLLPAPSQLSGSTSGQQLDPQMDGSSAGWAVAPGAPRRTPCGQRWQPCAPAATPPAEPPCLACCRDGPWRGVAAVAGGPQWPAGGVQQQEGPGRDPARHPAVSCGCGRPPTSSPAAALSRQCRAPATLDRPASLHAARLPTARCRKRARVSGFRARMATPAGRRVLAARRKKCRKTLVPALVPKRKM